MIALNLFKARLIPTGWQFGETNNFFTVLKGQVLSPVKVCEESEVTTNIQLYEIKQKSFAIKLFLKNVTALTNTFWAHHIMAIMWDLHSHHHSSILCGSTINVECFICRDSSVGSSVWFILTRSIVRTYLSVQLQIVYNVCNSFNSCNVKCFRKIEQLVSLPRVIRGWSEVRVLLLQQIIHIKRTHTG